VSGLTAANFRLLDNTVQQQVQVFSLESIPLDISFIVETTGLRQPSLNRLASNVRHLVALRRPDDRVRVLGFDSYVREIVPMRSLPDWPPIEFLEPTGQTPAVYDALLLGMLHPVEPGRRHLVLAFTRDTDLRSATSAATVRTVAQRSDLTLYIIRIGVDEPYRPRAAIETRFRADESAVAALTQAAEATGGEFLNRGLDRDRIERQFGEILSAFRQSYVLSYSPTGVGRKGWHDVRVELVPADRGTARARKGYFVE
jgi:hypothetical protein